MATRGFFTAGQSTFRLEGDGDEEDADRPPKHQHKKGVEGGNGTELCREVRTERSCSLGAASLRCAGETRAGLRGNKTSGTKDKRLERAGILPPWQQPTGGWFRLLKKKKTILTFLVTMDFSGANH